MITDNNSKFGTLVLLKEPIMVNEEKIAVQIGRTVLTFALKFLQTEANLPRLAASKFTVNNNTFGKKPSSTGYGKDDKNGFMKKKADLLYD